MIPGAVIFTGIPGAATGGGTRATIPTGPTGVGGGPTV